MRVRALIAAAAFGWGCTPSTDLASYSDGTEPLKVSPMAPGAEPDRSEGGGGGVAAAVGEGEGESDLPEMFEGDSPAAGSDGAAPATGDDEPDPAEEPPGEVVVVGEEPPSEPEPAPRFRFVRLVADSAVQGPFTSIAEFNVLDESGGPIDRASWTVDADSEELVYVGGAPAALAIDGVAISMWHTAWFEVEPPPHPHSLDIDMGAVHEVSGFRYLPRQDGSLDGRIGNYRLFVSVDGVTWGEPVAAGTLANTDAEQEILFAP